MSTLLQHSAARRTSAWQPDASFINAIAFFLILLSAVILYKLVYFLNTDAEEHIKYLWFGYSLLSGMFLLSRLPIAYLYDPYQASRLAHARNFRFPTVSIVIAAKNEDDSIFRTIETCMRSRYPAYYECIAVDDGSTDKTYAEMMRARRAFGRSRVKVVRLPVNKGKREAMFEGISIARNEIIVFVDSDSFLAPDAMKILVQHFANEDVGAVSGNTKVANDEVNLLTKMQSIRYAVSYDIFKVCESYYGVVTCCPGCFSAYRRTALMPILEGWRNQSFMGTKSTFGDDRSLTNLVLRDGWRVEYSQRAIAETIVPHGYLKFLKQQLRWKKSWIREGAVAAKFMWKRHPFAALAYYINLVLPVLAPFVVGLVIYLSIVAFNPVHLLIYVFGVVVMGYLFGTFLYLLQKSRYWYCLPLFSLLYTTVMIWQMPYAVLRINDTKWGTR